MAYNPFSQTSYYVEPHFEGKKLANGTCFFISRNNKTYLITNWHIVTGKNPITQEFLGYYAVSPDSLVVKVYKNQPNIETIDLNIPLIDEAGKKWMEHPIHGNTVDVIAIEVDIPSDMLIFFTENFIEPFNEDTNAKVKDDVFILGFPFGLSTGDIFPIWKRGSIASEPIIDIDELPKMYVDTATRSGMSGSPVLYIEKRAMGIGDSHPGTPGGKFSNNYTKLLGVYSGRIGAKDELQAQLGIIWKIEAVDEIINQ